MEDGLDVGGLLRRVRRRAVVSQRELAERMSVSPGTIAKVEGGGRVTVDFLERALGIAGLRLVVVDGDGGRVLPTRPDAVRDGGDRRFPAHLDVFGHWGVGLSYRADRPYPRPPGSASFSRRRTEPSDDHPSRAELLPARPGSRARPASLPGENCACGPECERRCVRTCGCQCEPGPAASRVVEQGVPAASSG